jgi:uncharacterized protein (DUF1697 family)
MLSGMTQLVALLRGVNVGGRTMIPMPSLKASLEDLGHEDVVTYIQSGNVVFKSRVKDPAKEIEERIAEDFGVPVTVIVRTPAELRKIVKANPFAKVKEGKKVNVVFLRETPPKSAAAGLSSDRSPGDELVLKGRDLYVHYANGQAKTKITNDWLEKTLGTRATSRNWNTVLKLVELTD